MTGWATETLLATTALMIVILIVRRPVARLFGAHAAYALWLAPLLRLIAPPLPVTVPVPDMLVVTGIGAAGSAPASPDLLPALPFAGLWLFGSAIFLLWQLIRYRGFLRLALGDARPILVETVDDAAVLRTSAVTGPCATGILIRRIFVPADFATNFSDQERDLAIAHEALHHRRHDLWASAAALLMLALHWFNPIAYMAHRAFRRDLEAACDATLLARRAPDEREAYARTILRCVAQPMPHPSCALTNVDELKGRLEMLNLHHGRGRRFAGLSLALGLAGGGLALAYPATAQEAPKATQERVEIRKIISDGKEGDVIRRGEPGELRAKFANCKGEKFEADSGAAGADGKKAHTRIMLCTKEGASKTETAAMLEKALSRIEGTDEMPAENKAQVVAKLKARIAELKAGS